MTKMPQRGWLMHKRNRLLTVPETGSLRSGWQPGQGRAPFPVAGSVHVPTVEGMREQAQRGLVHKGTKAVHEDSTLKGGPPCKCCHLWGLWIWVNV